MALEPKQDGWLQKPWITAEIRGCTFKMARIQNKMIQDKKCQRATHLQEVVSGHEILYKHLPKVCPYFFFFAHSATKQTFSHVLKSRTWAAAILPPALNPLRHNCNCNYAWIFCRVNMTILKIIILCLSSIMRALGAGREQWSAEWLFPPRHVRKEEASTWVEQWRRQNKRKLIGRSDPPSARSVLSLQKPALEPKSF